MLKLARRFFADSLFRNSAFLILDLGLSALCSFGSVALLTHIFSTRLVGLSATAVGACALITYITQFGITYSIPRFLPTAKNRAEMINTLLTAVLVATAIGSVIYLVLPFAYPLWDGLGGLVFAVMFIITNSLQAGQNVLSTALVADRSSDKIATWGMIPNLARLGAPPVFAVFGGFGAFTARVIADFFGFGTFGWLLARGGHKFRLKMDPATTRELVKSSTGMYVAGIVGGLPMLLLPIIVQARLGSDSAAYWSIAGSIGAILFSLPSMVTQALLPEVSLRPTERKSLLRRTSWLIMVMVVPALAIAFILAPFVIGLFNSSYVAETATPLRWLIVAGFITMLNYVTGAVLFIAKKSRSITIVNAVDAVIVLGLAMAWAHNVTQVAIAWTIGDIGNTVLFAVFAFFALREVGWRYEDLGGVEAASSAEPSEPTSLTATGQMRALGMLVTLSEQQATVDMYRPYNNSLTSTTGLFSIVALRAAERQRERFLTDSGSLPAERSPVAATVPARAAARPGAARPGPGAARPAAPDESAAGQQQGLAMLFKMAERQRTAEHTEQEPHPAHRHRKQPDNNE